MRKELYLAQTYYVYARYDINSTALVVINNGEGVTIPVQVSSLKAGAPELVVGNATATYSNNTVQINAPANSSSIFIMK